MTQAIIYHLLMKLIELKYEEAVAKVQQTLQAANYNLTCGPALPMMLTLA